MTNLLEKIVLNFGNILQCAGGISAAYNLGNYVNKSSSSDDLIYSIVGLGVAAAGAFIQGSIINSSANRDIF